MCRIWLLDPNVCIPALNASQLNAYQTSEMKLLLLWRQCRSLVWTPLCSCVWKSDRKTSWSNLKQMIRGTSFSPLPPRFVFVFFYSHWVAVLPFVIAYFLSLFCVDTKVMMLHFPLREYVVDLEESSQHLMRYRTVAPLVSSGAVQLIWMWKWVNDELERGAALRNKRWAKSFLLILHNALLPGHIWIYFKPSHFFPSIMMHLKEFNCVLIIRPCPQLTRNLSVLGFWLIWTCLAAGGPKLSSAS